MECSGGAGLGASLRSLTTAIGQLSNRRLWGQIPDSVEDGLELKEAGGRKTSQEVDAVQ